MTCTDESDTVPTEELAERLLTIAENRPDGTAEAAWVELCLVLGARVDARGRLYKKDIDLSSAAGAVAWKEDNSIPAVLSFETGYDRSGGQIRRAKTHIRVGKVVTDATDLCDELGVGYSSTAGATAGAKSRQELVQELEERGGENAASGTGRGASSGSGRSEGQSADPVSASASASRSSSSSCPYGCDTGEAETGENRRSERSDRKNGGGSKRSLERHRPQRDAFKTRGSRAQRRWLDTRARMPAERLLFLELLRHARRGIYQSGEQDEGMDWVGVEAEKMEEKMGAPFHATWKVWHESELIDPHGDGDFVSPAEAEETGQDPRTREFRISQDVLDEFTGLAEGSRRWWLQTAEPQRTDEPSPLSSDLKDENGNYHPDLIDKALRVLGSAEHRIDLDSVDEAVSALSEKSGRKARAQLSGLQLARETISRQAEGEEGVVTIQNAYKPDDSGGRITFKRGGPQGMLGAVKAKAYDLEGYRNYDIKSCHTAALKQWADELEELGVDIDTSALDEYPGKDKVVEDTGLPRGLVKVVEHSVKNSAYLPASLDQAELIEKIHLEEGRTLQIVDAARKADVDTDKALSKLYDVFADYRRVAIEIAEALLTTYWDEHKQPAGPKGWCMKNHCGVSFYRSEHIEDKEDDSWCHDARTAVMAWALRGLEGAFCHSITVLSATRTDFDVVANEHDGLITRGPIPAGIIQAAREMSGFHRAELAEKAFADQEDIQELYGVEAAPDGRESKPKAKPAQTGGGDEPTESGAEGEELDPVVRRHLQRKREEKRRRHRGPPDEVVAKHSPAPDERVELTAEEARRMRGRSRHLQ